MGKSLSPGPGREFLDFGGLALELCANCKTPIEPGDEECFVCQAPLPTSEDEDDDDTVENQFFYCDKCQARVDYGDLFCTACSTTLDADFWSIALGEVDPFNQIEEDDDSFLASLDRIREAEQTQLCCNRPEFECQCDNIINPMNLYAGGIEEYYAAEAKCDRCVFFCTPACPPLRSAYKKSVTGNKTDDIIPCGSFKLITD